MEEERKGHLNKRLLAGILTILVLMIVGLAIGILVINIRKANDTGQELGSEENTSTQTNEEVSVLDPENENIAEEIAEIEEELGTIENPSVEQVVEIYQRYVDGTDDTDKRVSLLRNRIYAVQAIDINYEHGDQVIADTLAIDDILKSLSSAAQVMNEASLYHDDELYAEYANILQEREANEGIDASAGGQG